MEQQKNNDKEIIMQVTNKINIGLALIILSPLVGSLLFKIYTGFVGSMISTNAEVDMFWFACILATIVTGIAMVLVGCTANKAVNNSNTK